MPKSTVEEMLVKPEELTYNTSNGICGLLICSRQDEILS